MVGHENQDVAIKAINHPNADLDIVQAGLNRKAKAVQDAATKHPLVANNLVKSRLISGQMSGTKLFTDKDVGEIYSNLPEEDRQQVDAALDKRYSYSQPHIGAEFPGIHALSLDLGVSPEDLFKVKTHLAENKDPTIANRHKTDLINDFRNKYGSFKFPEEYDSKVIRPSYYIGKANSGDPAFQNLALESNGLLAKLDLKNGDYSGDFLRKVSEKLGQGPLSISYHDSAPVRDGNEDRHIMNGIFQNPSLPQDVFEQYATNPHALKLIAMDDLLRDGLFDKRTTVEPGKENTIFDKRYSKMDPVQKRQYFMHLRDLNTPESNEYILRSSSAPEDMWKEAWGRLSLMDRKRVLDKASVERMAPLDVKRQILDGNWEGLESHQSARKNLLASLSPDKPEDVNLFNNWYKDQVEVRGVDANNFRPDLIEVNPRFYSTPAGNEMMKKALEDDPLHGSAPAVAKAFADAGVDKNQPYQYKTKAKQLLSNIQNEFAGLSPNSLLNAWYGTISRNADKFGEIAKTAETHDNRGIFDFLVDIPGDPDNKNLLMGKVLGLGLLSKEKRDQVAYDPNSFSAALRNAAEPQVKSLIRGYLDSDAPKTSGNMALIASQLNPRTFYPYDQIKRTSMDQSDLDNCGHYIKKFVEAAESSGLESKDIVRGLSTAAWTHDGATKDKLAVGGKIIEAVNGLTKTPTEMKNSILLKIAANNNNAKVSKVFDAAVAQNIIATNDITSALKMADEWITPPQAVLRFLAKAAKNPKSLDDTSLSHLLAGQLEARSTTAILSRSLTKAAFDRIDIREAEKSEVAGHLRAVLLGSLNRVVSSSTVTPENATNCYDSLMKFGVKYGQSPEYHDAMLGAASISSQLPTELKAKAFISLPYDLSQAHGRGIDPEVFARPEAVEAATGGWKLESAMISPDRLSKDGVSVIVNRALEVPQLMTNEGERFASRLMVNRNASDEDVTKVIRATGRMGIEHLFRERMSFGYADTPATRSHLLFGPMVDVITERMTQSETLPIERADGDIPINLQLIFNAAGKYKPGQEGDSDAVAATHKAINLLDRHLNWLKPHWDSDPDTASLPTVNQANLSAKAATQLGQIAGIDDPEYSLKALGIYKKAWEMSKAYPGEGFDPKHYIANWVSNQSDGLSTGQWASVFASHPEAVGGIGHRKVVDTDILDAFPWEQYKNVGGAAIEATAFSTWANKMSDAAKEKYAERMFDSVGGMKDANHDDVDTVEGLIRGLGAHITKKALDRNLSNIAADHKDYLYQTALESGAGGKDLFDEKSAQCFKGSHAIPEQLNTLNSAVGSPHIDEKFCDRFISSFDTSSGKVDGMGTFAYGDLLQTLLSNPYLPEGTVDRTIPMLEPLKNVGYPVSELSEKLMKSSGLSKPAFMQLHETTKDPSWPGYFEPHKKFPISFNNRRFGGDLLRSLPSKAPSIQGIDQTKLIDKVSTGKAVDRLSKTMQSIPAAGMFWKDFKRQFAQLAVYPEVQEVFMRRNNKLVFPEDVAKDLAEVDADSYHVSYSEWDSELQKHNPKENEHQLVVQLNNSKKIEDELSKDPKMWAVYHHLQSQINHTGAGVVGLHPTTPQSVSWARVDQSSGQEGWIVEEFQSDTLRYIKRMMDGLVSKNPEKIEVDGHSLTPDELTQYGKKIRKTLSGWLKAQYQAVENLARKQGVKTLYIHGTGIRSYLSGYNEDEVPEAFGERYDELAQENGFEKCDYSDYPSQSRKTKSETKAAGLSTHCWRKKLA